MSEDLRGTTRCAARNMNADRRVSMIFVGQKNFYTEFLADWLAERTDLRGVIWTACTRTTLRAKWHRLTSRIKRMGLFRVLSEIMYYGFNRRQQRQDEADLRRLISDARADGGIQPRSYRSFEVPSLRNLGVTNFLEERDGDTILTQCINEVVPEAVFSQPRIGCFVYHEGVVPQYRGKFGTLWAILNRDFGNIGASGSVHKVSHIYFT